MKVRLYEVANARSGDKGDGSNVGLIARTPELYEVIRKQATAERVGEHFRQVARGGVDRYEVPNLLAMNFILKDSLGGGGTESLKNDAQGKTHAQGLLQMEVEIPDALLDAMKDALQEKTAVSGGSDERPPFERLTIRRDRDLLWVTLNDPERANALSPVMIEELTALYRSPLREEGIRAVILSGAGKNFSAGADLEHLASLRDAGEDENLRDSLRLRDLFESVLRQDALTIALVHGACVAGGCGIATAHDFVIAAEDSKFLYSEVRIGFVAALVATYLPLRLRGSDIREMLLFPRFVEARKALEIGLVNRLCPAGDLAEVGEALAAEILQTASSESIARTKKLILDVVGRPLDQSLLHAAGVNAASRSTADCKHGIATFLETKKPPRWRD